MIRTYRALSALAVVMLTMIATPVLAEERPIQLSLITPVQIFPEEDNIAGVCLNLIYGRNSSIRGLDFGLVNHSTSGISMGWQTGLVGIVDADFVGLQDNAVNMVKSNFKGLQWGVVNYAKAARGLQLGVVNYAERMYGLQIGLVNIITRDSDVPVLPIINWSF